MIVNSFLLDFPSPNEDGEHADRLYRPETASTIIQAVVLAWEPDWATWVTPTMRNNQGRQPGELVVGWFTYIRGVTVTSLPAGAARRFADGTLIQAAPEFADVTADTVVATRDALRSQSALQPAT
ncbi:hypothetical protein GCM10009785_25330 [Brooklawnia cerclae]|uniref:Immunity protein 52 domain-containing protein n=2 Tax=Brooklawnia cerclae TaxID=349934 RepID=A0ABX0SAT4_9ACTN|nr:Imm52 family immunity protein [Brooklawnia cerclae]NIH55503.1 hypothetical protein [Brooklawnia cerclae]